MAINIAWVIEASVSSVVLLLAVGKCLMCG